MVEWLSHPFVAYVLGLALGAGLVIFYRKGRS
jgi:hypothetical protein